ncbi:MAG: hypothetical protein KKD39_04300 [Candidatus Altiarchaeota archaeon]|nr:hypothetical protein [Candidatus Altiarchaeota archaeon]
MGQIIHKTDKVARDDRPPDTAGIELKPPNTGLVQSQESITSLMRYREQLRFFRGLVGSIKKPNERLPIDLVVFSLACATGEEPASIAAVALDEMGKKGIRLCEDVNLRVVGVDIDRRSVEKAREKISHGFTIRDTVGKSSPEDLEFVNSRLNEINQVVEIREGNITKPGEIMGLTDANVIFLNAASIHAFKPPNKYREFVDYLAQRVKGNCVIFTTDLFFHKNPDFIEMHLDDKTWLYRKR